MGRKSNWFPWKRGRNRLKRHNGVKLQKIDGNPSDSDVEGGRLEENEEGEVQTRITRDGLGEEITKYERGEDEVMEAGNQEDEEDEEGEDDGINEVFEGTSFQITQEQTVIKTVKDAVVNADIKRLKELLAEDSPIGDALLNAAAQANQLAVQTICNHIASEKTASNCYEIINAYAEGPEFLPSSTPLQIAARANNFEIVQILIRHGAILPDLKKCLHVHGVKEDKVVQCFAFLQYVKAVASPSLILLTEINPVGRAYRIAIDLSNYSESGDITRMLKSHPNFTQQIEDVVDGTEDLLCDLLSQCKSRREIQAFLQISATPKMSEKCRNHGMVTKHQHEDSSLPTGLEQAISMGFKKLVAHPFSQMIVTECVFNGPVNWDDMSSATFIFVSLLVIIFSPVLCISYSLCPVRKLVEFMQTPYVRVLTSFSSHLFFLFFLLLTAINIDYINAECPDIGIGDSQYRTCSEVTLLFWPIYGRVVLIGIVVCGQTLWLSSSCYKIGFSSISGHKLQWVVIIQTLLFTMSLVAYVVSLVQVEIYSLPSDGESPQVFLLNRKPYNNTVYVSVGENLYQPSRGYWNNFDAQIVAEITFSLANILTVQRFLHTCIFFEGIGPLIISIGRMLSGIMKFAVVSFLILMSFALGFTQLFAPYVDLQSCENEMDEDALKHCGDASMFSSVRQSLNTLFWAIFGEFHITDMKLPSSLSIVQYTGQILHAIYIIMTSIILLNLLIAAMLTTYDSIQGNVYTEWKFSRTNMMREYCGHRSNVPVPFNLFPSVRVIFDFLSAIYRKIVALLINCGFKVPEKAKKNTYYKWRRKSADGVSANRCGQIKFKERHQVIQTLVERYKHMHWQTSPPSRDLLHLRTDADRLRLAQSVTSFSTKPGADSRLNSVARPRASEVFSPTATEPTIRKAPSIETMQSLSKASSVETMPFVRGSSSLRSLPSYTSRPPSEPRNGNNASRPVTRPHRGAIRKKHRPGSVSLV